MEETTAAKRLKSSDTHVFPASQQFVPSIAEHDVAVRLLVICEADVVVRLSCEL